MRLGGQVHGKWTTPDEWVALVRGLGYGAAYCPVGSLPDSAAIRAYEQAARQADLVIAEVGAWSNPLSPDAATAQEALTLCQTRLALADEIGARCCVNISGSRGAKWDGPHPLNFTEETFDRIVEVTRSIIDAVRPTRTYFTLETMPWMYPDSPDSYLRLLKAIDRERFAVHFDPVNLVCSPQRYFATGALIREFVDKLGPWIKSCHAKDILLSEKLTTHLDEVRPGLGGLDYAVYLRELNRLEPTTPLMIEHLKTAEEFAEAAAHIRAVAAAEGITIG